MEALRLADSLILEVLRSTARPLTCEEIIARIPELTWNQVFLSVDALSRRGEVILNRRGFDYQATAVDNLATR
jgi:hypothetical protein